MLYSWTKERHIRTIINIVLLSWCTTWWRMSLCDSLQSEQANQHLWHWREKLLLLRSEIHITQHRDTVIKWWIVHYFVIFHFMVLNLHIISDRPNSNNSGKKMTAEQQNNYFWLLINIPEKISKLLSPSLEAELTGTSSCN